MAIIKFTEEELYNSFPPAAHPRPIQKDAIAAIVKGADILELPTGTGKTHLEYMLAKAILERLDAGQSVFWVFPTRQLVQQAKLEYPEICAIYGKNDHVCVWANKAFTEEPKKLATLIELPMIQEDRKATRVSDIPQALCGQCPHFVNQEDGTTRQPESLGCTYYQQTYEAKLGNVIIAATMSFYIFAKLFARRKEEDDIHQTSYGHVVGLVIDEVHRLPDVIRYTLSYDITDWHLEKAIALLVRINAPEAAPLSDFLEMLNGIAKARGKQTQKEHLLTNEEIVQLVRILEKIDPKVLDPKRINQAVRDKLLDRKKDFDAIKTIEVLGRDIRRYIHTMEYALPGEEREGKGISKRGGPLNYSCSYFKAEMGPRDKVENKLILHCHAVAPLIRKRLVVPNTFSFTATLGRPELFKFESGIEGNVFSAPSTFPVENRLIFAPIDTHNLARSKDPSGRKRTQALRQIAKGCRELFQEGIRSLVLVQSNDERTTFMRVAKAECLDALTYNDDIPAKETARKFIHEGVGEALVGCISHYGVGLDLANGVAPAIWFLRPGYSDPESASSKFEVKRYGEGGYWKRQYYKVVLEVLQAMGRNIRGPRDKGVCFLVSAAFKDFTYASLPDWLREAYDGKKTVSECLDKAKELLRKK